MTIADPSSREPLLESLYEQLRKEHPHDIGGVHEAPLGENDRIVLIPVGGTVPDERAPRERGAFQKE
jgi:hypothetical protein